MSTITARCVQCGFKYAWDGRECRHCHYPRPTREAWSGFDRLDQQIARYHPDPGPGGLGWFAVACLRRVETLLGPDHRLWLDGIEAHLNCPAHPLPEDLMRWIDVDAFPEPPPSARTQAEDAVTALARELARDPSPDPAGILRVCSRARVAVGLAEYPLRALASFPLPSALEPYRADALADDEPQPRPKERHADQTLRRRAYHSIRYEAAKYEAQRRPVERAEEAVQCAIYRDVFGYPFEPVRFDPGWRTSTAVGLAEAIHAEQAFDRLPILADALEEAGCDDERLLYHCRTDDPHVRGCRVVELLRPRTAPGG